MVTDALGVRQWNALDKALTVSVPAKLAAPVTRHAASLDVAQAFRQHHPFVWRSLACMGVDAALIDDAVQDVFLTAYRRRCDYDSRGSERRWLYGIARMIARNYRRKSARRRTEALGIDATKTDEWSEHRLARRQMVELVQRFIGELPDPQRDVFVLAHVHGLSAPEIGEILAVKVNTIYSRLRTARARFDQLVADYVADHSMEELPWNT